MIIKATRWVIDIIFKLIISIAIIYLILCAFGIRFYVVPTGSMEPYIHTDSLVVVNENVEFKEIQKGDIIVYDQAEDRRIIHRVVEINENGIKTQGDANPVPDSAVITEENYVGKFVHGIPELGKFFKKMNEVSYRIKYLAITVTLYLVDAVLGKIEKKRRNRKPKETE